MSLTYSSEAVFFSQIDSEIKRYLVANNQSTLTVRLRFVCDNLLFLCDPKKWAYKTPSREECYALKDIIYCQASILSAEAPNLWASIKGFLIAYTIHDYQAIKKSWEKTVEAEIKKEDISQLEIPNKEDLLLNKSSKELETLSTLCFELSRKKEEEEKKKKEEPIPGIPSTDSPSLIDSSLYKESKKKAPIGEVAIKAEEEGDDEDDESCTFTKKKTQPVFILEDLDDEEEEEDEDESSMQDDGEEEEPPSTPPCKKSTSSIPVPPTPVKKTIATFFSHPRKDSLSQKK